MNVAAQKLSNSQRKDGKLGEVTPAFTPMLSSEKAVFILCGEVSPVELKRGDKDKDEVDTQTAVLIFVLPYKAGRLNEASLSPVPAHCGGETGSLYGGRASADRTLHRSLDAELHLEP